MAIQFNVEPYWDDFESVASGNTLSPKEQYQKILFRPGKAVQARELTQLQTSLQHQISAHGDHAFKDGSVVVPGAVHLHNKIDYVRLSACNTSLVTDIVGTEYSDASGNVAKVIHAALASGDDSITIWVQYISGAVFASGASLTATGSKTATVASSNDANGKTPIGFGSIVSLEDGIYYIKKHFVTAKAKTIILSKYSSNVSFDIGLLVTESLVSSGTDASLNDNATGTPNAAAPGAHRYSITATLSTQAVNANSGNFVLIARLESGIITKNARTADYNLLGDELARRTFDESGNYYVNPFKALVKTHQVSSPDATKLTLAVEPSKAYVRGYEIETLATTNVHFDRARTSEVVSDKLTEVTHNNYIEVTAMTGTPDITTFGKISIENAAGDEIGTCRARSIERVSGNGASSGSRYRIHIFEVEFVVSNTTGMANATQLDDKEGTAAGTAFAATIASYNLGPDTLVYKLPYERIKTLNGATSGSPVYDFSYKTNRIIGSATVSATGTATFTAASANEQFISDGTNTNWILINDTNDGDGGEAISNTSTQITIDNSPVGGGDPVVVISGLPTTGDLGDGGSDGAINDTVRLIAPMKRTLTHKTKTLQTNVTTDASNVAGSGFTGTGHTLGHADIYRIVSVVEHGTSPLVDVTTHFELDNGQKDTHYDLGKVKIKTTSNYTLGVNLTVTYDYFTHSAGDFFSVDSYTGEIAYGDIPKFGDIELRSAVDFRPRVGDAGNQFTEASASTSFCPIRFSQFSTDIQFYLPRIDKVYLDSKGNFGISPGVPARYPEPTAVPSDAMHLYTMTIPAYTLNPGEVTVDFIDQRRYTMRDIGKIEKRINQIEYYSVLSFLEAEAQNKQIIDTGNVQRWKSGFLVDAFSNTRMSNSASPEYRASVDISNRTLRPPFSQGNAALSYHNTGGDASTTQKTGDLVTLPYTSAALITQGQYSGNINVNPYDVFNWTGSMSLTPSTDEWRDIDRRPEVVINNDGEFDAMMANLQPQVGTVWGEWSTNWSGNFSTRREGNWRVRTQTGTATRTGVQQTIEVQTSRFSTGDRIVEVNFVPFMRTRLVEFSATRMKPATQVYAFFDGTSVADYVSTNASSYTPLVGVNTVVAHPATATTLTTDANGAVSGTFLVPNNSTLNFPTGQKEFKLTQSSTNDDEVTTTSATANYNAAGLIETRENVIISTRTPVIQRLSVGDTRGDSREVGRNQINWNDPLAQSILLDQAAFITSVALNFTSKDASIPVNVSIREMSNGFPTQKIIPFSDITLNPSAVSTSAATTFTFASPVFLQDGIEYAIVIMSNSNKYNVRYAQIGDEDQNGNRISQQPYNGVLFKSQNASTWNADQNKDLMFTLNRAVFSTTAKNCVLRNAALPSRQLVSNPLTTLATATSANSIFTVAHRDHGMKAGDSVTLAGFTATNGFTTGNLNDTHTITAVTRDSYTITIIAAEHGTITAGNGGGTTCQATQHLAWNTIHPIIQQVVLPNTTQTWTVKDSLESSGSITSTAAAITVNKDYTPLYPKVIKSGATHTIEFNGTFTTTSDYLSPVIDLERCSAITISNRIDNNAGAVAETTASTGSNLAKYVTKTIELQDTSDEIKVYLDINRPNNSFVDLYYKTGNTAATFDTESWVLQAPAENSGQVAFSDGTTYDETVYNIAPTATFTIFAIKIVMRSTGTSYIPKCQDLRAIALKV
jgi:hypothetical protein